MKQFINSIKAVSVILILGLTYSSNAQKNTLKTTTTTKINASKSEVMNVIKSYELFPEWSPFLESDPNQKYELGGTDGAIGSTFSWEGVDEKSKGTQAKQPTFRQTKLPNNLKRNEKDDIINNSNRTNPFFSYRIL